MKSAPTSLTCALLAHSHSSYRLFVDFVSL
ncbi:hypothetical protein MPTK2_5g90080P [Marchantia polymorpha subsp. ruderalis]